MVGWKGRPCRGRRGRDFAGVVVHGPAELLDQEVWGTGGDVGFTRDGTHADVIVASTLPFFILALPAGSIGDIVDRRT